MLEYYFKAQWSLRRHRCGPLAPHIDNVAAALHEQGYRWQTARPLLRIIARFSAYAEARKVTNAVQITERLTTAFLRSLRRQGKFPEGERAMAHLLRYLGGAGVVVTPPHPMHQIPREEIFDRYQQYLAEVRGLPLATQHDYHRGACRLVAWTRKEHIRGLKHLNASHVLDYVAALAGRHDTRSWRNRLTSQTRVFLRFLQWDGVTDLDLARFVPKVASWQLASIPRHMGWDQVRSLIANVDTAVPIGKRDKAVILLVAVLGMRGADVRNLELGDIRWRRGEIHLPQTKNRRARLVPLPNEVGSALADYVLHGRPLCTARQLVVRHQAPVGPLSSPSAVGRIVARRLRGLAGPTVSRPGTQLLRHSLATQMVNTGAPIKDVADVLGHASVNTTAIYAKVDLAGLSAIPLPFPGESA